MVIEGISILVILIMKKKLKLPRGPIKLKPTQIHKSKKKYNRKKSKLEIKSAY